MDNSKRDILIVDDDKNIRDLISLSLKNKFNVSQAESGEQALELIKEVTPLVILLDINMDGMNGKDACKKIREAQSGKESAIVFVSGDSDEEIVLECFDLGADDFIAKPFELANFTKKIEMLARHQSLVWHLKSSETELSTLVDTTFKQAANYGAALNLVKNLNLANDESGLATHIFSYFESFGIVCALNFRAKERDLYFDARQKYCSPIEQEVFSLTSNKGRLYNFGSRLIVNDKHVSMLIKNVPAPDGDEYGLFIDIVAVLIEALEARYASLLNERKMESVQSTIRELCVDINVTMAELQKSRQQMVENIVTEVGLSFHQLEMTEDQEQFFTQLIEASVLTHDEGNNDFFELQEKLSQVANMLSVERVEHQPIAEDDGNSSGAELF